MRVEAVLRAFYADQGDVTDLIASSRTTAEDATRMLKQLGSFVEEYLAGGGLLDLLQSSDG